MDRSRDILELLHSGVFQCHVEFVRKMLVGCCGNGDPSRICDFLESCSYIHAVAQDVVTVDDDIANIEADTEQHLPLVSDLPIAFGHSTLKLNRTLESFDHAGKFEQQAVTHRLDDAPMMLTDLGPNQFFAMRFLGGDRPFLS